MIRIYVERKAGFDNEARRIYADISGFLGIDGVTSVRYLNRYDVENVSDDVAKAAATRIFSEPQSDSVAFEEFNLPDGATQIIWE
ncbi:MAG: hypothetical protein J6Y60_06115, partial [Treponema sp.]|nr:hypothetical protein [Treponema sp.]